MSADGARMLKTRIRPRAKGKLLLLAWYEGVPTGSLTSIWLEVNQSLLLEKQKSLNLHNLEVDPIL